MLVEAPEAPASPSKNPPEKHGAGTEGQTSAAAQDGGGAVAPAALLILEKDGRMFLGG